MPAASFPGASAAADEAPGAPAFCGGVDERGSGDPRDSRTGVRRYGLPELTSIDIGTVGHGLAARAPEGDACVRPLNAAANGLSASAAGLTVAAVDPNAGCRVGRVRCAASCAGVGDECVG